MSIAHPQQSCEGDGAGSMPVSRRQFLISSVAGASGLLLTCAFDPLTGLAQSPVKTASIPLNAWLRINNDDTVTVIVSQAEIGQGISTTLPAVLADELGADWARVKLENSPADPAYRNPRIN